MATFTNKHLTDTPADDPSKKSTKAVILEPFKVLRDKSRKMDDESKKNGSQVGPSNPAGPNSKSPVSVWRKATSAGGRDWPDSEQAHPRKEFKPPCHDKAVPLRGSKGHLATPKPAFVTGIATAVVSSVFTIIVSLGCQNSSHHPCHPSTLSSPSTHHPSTPGLTPSRRAPPGLTIPPPHPSTPGAHRPPPPIHPADSHHPCHPSPLPDSPHHPSYRLTVTARRHPAIHHHHHPSTLGSRHHRHPAPELTPSPRPPVTLGSHRHRHPGLTASTRPPWAHRHPHPPSPADSTITAHAPSHPAGLTPSPHPTRPWAHLPSRHPPSTLSSRRHRPSPTPGLTVTATPGAHAVHHRVTLWAHATRAAHHLGSRRPAATRHTL
ncbi:extensin-like [Penaeus japonicus]|uniref:extensin-like n=1 Tax=Penaeus japonicus TaxID=27405 RepID=UPI001C70E0F3|nr:extensin-like [Penaeus japonicus]